jgi:hypothetical protein
VSDSVQSRRDEKPDYFYVRHVTLGQFFKLLKGVAGWWLGLSIFAHILGLVFHSAKAVVSETSFMDSVPKQFWIWLAVAILSWVFKGHTFTLPKLSFVSWILLNVWLGGAVLADAFLPWWAAATVYQGLFLLGFVYEQLVEIGKANYDSVNLNVESTVAA